MMPSKRSLTRVVVSRCLPLVMLMTMMVIVAPCGAFVLSHGPPACRRSNLPPLADSFHEDQFSGSNSNYHHPQRNHNKEIEDARNLFERLALNATTGTLQSTSTTTSTLSPPPRRLTAQMERLRTTEIQLLQALDRSDAALEPLVELWVKEKQGEGASQVLHKMMMNHVCPDIQQEEKTLRRLVQEHDQEHGNLVDSGPPSSHHLASTWVEPHARLAVLLFSKGEYDEALALCDYVLLIKPWHFEIAQLFRIGLLKVGNWPFALRVTRELTLPPLHHPKRRAHWIQKMTNLAQERLELLPSSSSPFSPLESLPPALTTCSQTIIIAQPFSASIPSTTPTSIDSDECDVDNPHRDCFQ